MTVTGARYRDRITQFFLFQLDDIDIYLILMCFQQDGVICHIARETVQLLHETFLCRLLSYFGD